MWERVELRNCPTVANRVLYLSLALVSLLILAFISVSTLPLQIPHQLSSTPIDLFSEAEVQDNSLVFTCLGDLKFQPYIWLALEQARTFNPTIPVLLILERQQYATNERARMEMARLRVQPAFTDSLSTPALEEFRKVFFTQGAMAPDGNSEFTRVTSERLAYIQALMTQRSMRNVLHLENDNMLYVDVRKEVLPVISRSCPMSLGVPFANKEHAIVSFVYIEDAAGITHLISFMNEAYAAGQEALVKHVGSEWVNDMTLTAQYFKEKAERTRAQALPAKLYTGNDTNCLATHTNLIFDAVAIGQWFGGSFQHPYTPYWDDGRDFDIRGLELEWRNTTLARGETYRVPYVAHRRVVNIHLHSKRLQDFSSVIPEGKPLNYTGQE